MSKKCPSNTSQNFDFRPKPSAALNSGTFFHTERTWKRSLGRFPKTHENHINKCREITTERFQIDAKTLTFFEHGFFNTFWLPFGAILINVWRMWLHFNAFWEHFGHPTTSHVQHATFHVQRSILDAPASISRRKRAFRRACLWICLFLASRFVRRCIFSERINVI